MARFLVLANWQDNAPHLSEEVKRDLWNSIPEYQKDARTKGIPQLGAGVIYPIADSEILCDPFVIPKHYLRGYSLDVGWGRTCALWRAKDPETKVSYFYDEHYQAESTPEIHGAAIRRRGLWIPGRIDPAARGRKQDDGLKMLTLYRKAIYGEEDLSLGVRMLGIARNAVESGIYELLMGFQQGMVKVFRNRCPNFLAERRLYRRNERGEVIKTFDHAMDTARYNVASGDAWLAQEPAPVVKDPTDRFTTSGPDRSLGWMLNV